MQNTKQGFRIQLGTKESGVGRSEGVNLPQANKGFSTEIDSTRNRQLEGKTSTGLEGVRPATWAALGLTILGVPVILLNLARSVPSGPLQINVEAESAKYEHYMGVAHGSSKNIRDELQFLKILEDTGRQTEAERELQGLLLAFREDPANPVYQLAKVHLTAQAKEVRP